MYGICVISFYFIHSWKYISSKNCRKDCVRPAPSTCVYVKMDATPSFGDFMDPKCHLILS